MAMNVNIFSGVITLFCVLALCNGYPRFLDLIPNSRNVPNPCTPDPTDKWKRVGHVVLDKAIDVNKTKNAFGTDFKAQLTYIQSEGLDQSVIWERLCPLNSDGDSRTNGQELGDPNCEWRSNNHIILQTEGITHPGIYEELDGSVRDFDTVCVA